MPWKFREVHANIIEDTLPAPPAVAGIAADCPPGGENERYENDRERGDGFFEEEEKRKICEARRYRALRPGNKSYFRRQSAGIP